MGESSFLSIINADEGSSMSEIKIGVIGGSGLYEMDGLQNAKEVKVQTPFGDPSDALVQAKLGDVEVFFLPRHGRGHRVSPSGINYRANIWAMKKLGVTHIISVSACGSLREEIEPGHIVCIDQFFDRTRGRMATFFREGIVAHVAFADPICVDLKDLLFTTGKDLGIKIHDGGTYVCMEGPAFSTRAESHFYRSIKADVIGMTNLTEAKLAREAEICYATLALVTDYDCWKTHDADVDVQEILRIMSENVANAKSIIAKAVPKVQVSSRCGCPDALKFAIMTNPETILAKVREDLDVIVGKYLG